MARESQKRARQDQRLVETAIVRIEPQFAHLIVVDPGMARTPGISRQGSANVFG